MTFTAKTTLVSSLLILGISGTSNAAPNPYEVSLIRIKQVLSSWSVREALLGRAITNIQATADGYNIRAGVCWATVTVAPIQARVARAWDVVQVVNSGCEPQD